MPEFTPDTSRNEDAYRRIIYDQRSAYFAVVHFNLETTNCCKYDLVARPMGMPTTHYVRWYIRNPEHTLDGEREVYISL